jgi:hypothetical protein
MPEVEIHDVAFERRTSIVMEALRARLAMYGGLRHPVKRVVGPIEEITTIAVGRQIVRD